MDKLTIINEIIDQCSKEELNSIFKPLVDLPLSPTKTVVCSSKFLIGVPIRIMESTSNGILGFVEERVIGTALPMNVPEVYKLNEGPRIEDLKKIKRPIINWLLNRLK